MIAANAIIFDELQEAFQAIIYGSGTRRTVVEIT